MYYKGLFTKYVTEKLNYHSFHQQDVSRFKIENS